MRTDLILRAGEVTEIVGRLSSGRTSLLVAALARVMRTGAATALVDVDDAFDPTGAARAGIDLARLLWVRCGRRRDVALRAADALVRCPGFAVVALDLGELVPRLPLTGAFRLRLAVRRSGVALVVLASRRVAGAGAALAVETVPAGIDWSGPSHPATRLTRLRSSVRVVRARRATDWGPSDGGAMPGPCHFEWWSV